MAARRRYCRELKVKVGQWLLEDPEVRRADVARMLGVSVSTLKNWVRHARRGDFPRVGRPAHGPEAHERARSRVEGSMAEQGCPGFRPVKAACPEVPTRLVQLYVRRVKEDERLQERRRIEASRVRVEVLGRDVVWGQDGWHLGRLPDGRALESQFFMDRGSLRTVSFDVGLAQSQEDLIAQLEVQRLTRGLPLVVSSDNLSSCCGRKVQAYLAFHKVIHLLSLPHTPEHNGAAEHRVRELREVTGFRKGTVHGGVLEPTARLICSAGALDARRRASKGYKTALELDAALPAGYNLVCRARFYEEARRRMNTAVLGARSWREARLLEREAVFAALESCGLVRRVGGGRSPRALSGAVFS